MEQYEQYIALRKEFLSEAKLYLTRSDVIALKIRHQQAINSVRTYESIENIEQLVRVLEKRGVIRYDKIQLLKNIAQNFPHHSVINTKFNKYMAWLENYTPYPPETNLYQCSNVHYIPEPSAPPSQVVNPGFAEGSRIPYARNDPNKETEIRNTPDRQNYQWYPSTSESVMYSSYSQTQPEDQQKIMYTVFNGVSEAVGKSWRDVARYLDVREGDIDRIDTQFNSDSKEKAFAALKIFAAKSDLRCWSINLKNALEKARRKDLRNLVDDLLTRK
ncbi:fas-associated death domain protein isoform X2 [Neodiprion pinetum]|uniref:fas-associated death domain protein isoform X2 n=1 Tax=Neodiprion pinetum TaxID=441929 RepID=UPI001EDD60C7|nr:fas-associated death domain protein-like isoform X2 [Neodiprion pinetum]